MSNELIRLNGKVHTMSDSKDSILYPIFKSDLTKDDYVNWGMESLIGYEDEIDKVGYQMEFVRGLGFGQVHKQTIDKSRISIKNINIG